MRRSWRTEPRASLSLPKASATPVSDAAGMVVTEMNTPIRVLDRASVGALAAIGSPEVCLEWSTSQALAAGATEEEVAGVLLAVAPVIGLGRIVAAAPGLAVGLGYDIDAALEEPGGSLRGPVPAPLVPPTRR